MPAVVVAVAVLAHHNPRHQAVLVEPAVAARVVQRMFQTAALAVPTDLSVKMQPQTRVVVVVVVVIAIRLLAAVAAEPVETVVRASSLYVTHCPRSPTLICTSTQTRAR
jgi:hypothetical protein